MKFAIFVFLTSILAHGQQFKDFNIQHGGFDRHFIVFVPTTYKPNSKLPVVFGFHGGGGRGIHQEVASQMSKTAEKNGFILVYPDGINRSWGDSRGTKDASLRGVDDKGFIKEIIRILSENYSIDKERIYGTGLSNGAFFSLFVACHMSDVFAAVAPVAGLVPEPDRETCLQGRPMPVFWILGTHDVYIPIGGGNAGATSGTVLSAAESFNVFARRNSCKQESGVFAQNPQVEDGTKVFTKTFTECNEGANVKMVQILGGGHTWPGGTDFLPEGLVGKVSHNYPANDKIWEFFKTKTLKGNVAKASDVESEGSLVNEGFPKVEKDEIDYIVSTAELNLFVPRFTLATDLSTKSKNESGTGELQTSSYSVKALVPLTGYLNKSPGEQEAFQLFVSANYSMFNPQTDAFRNQRNFHKASLGLVGAYYFPVTKKSILFVGGGGISEDSTTIKSPEPLGYGLGLVGLPSGLDTTFYVGGGYAYVFGKGFVFPALGMTYRFNERWSIATVLPLMVAAKYRISRQMGAGFGIRMAGGQYRVSNQNEYAGRPDVLYFREYEVRTGPDFTYKFSRTLGFRLEAGVTSKRYVKVTSDGDDLYSETSKAAGYVMGSVSLAFEEPVFDFGL